MKNKITKTIIKKTKIHGNGIFAGENIPKGRRIIEYIGEKITKSEAEKRIKEIDKKAKTSGIKGAYYIFELSNKYDLDGNVPYNKAKYINHSCEPNCETIDEDGKIWIAAAREIKKGEELTYDYCFDFDVDEYKDSPCNCGSDNCIGYIIAKKDRKKLLKYSQPIKFFCYSPPI
ncbi:SET domain-containing protein-lysine N-methyltransferase [Candidatus Pacearchaeota archaeon]|nr:SET domain-containing protein-lysine N-methyltransferase [Candidatus Pacearchaeota archaeon]